jgi:hypothetical protein
MVRTQGWSKVLIRAYSVTQSLWFVIAVVAMAVSIVSVLLLGYSAQYPRNREIHGQEPRDHELREEIAALRESLRGVVERLTQFEEKLFDTRQGKLESYSPNDHAYGIAIRLVHKGANVNELMSVCGLTRGEAELIIALHELNKAS